LSLIVSMSLVFPRSLSAGSMPRSPVRFGRLVAVVVASVLMHALLIERAQHGFDFSLGSEPAAGKSLRVALVAAAPAAAPPPAQPPQPVRRARPKPPPKPTPVAPPPSTSPALQAPPAELVIDPRVDGLEVPAEELAAAGADEPAIAQPPAAEPAAKLPKPDVAPPETSAPPAYALAAELGAQGAADSRLPERGRYVYQTTDSRYAGVGGETTVRWLMSAESFEAHLTTTVLGIQLLELHSEGMLRSTGLAPVRYTQRAGWRAPWAVNIDWFANKVTFSGASQERPAREGLQDRLSFQFQLMLLAQRLPQRFTPGSVIEMPVTGSRELESYRFDVTEPETLVIAGQAIETVKLDRAPGGPGAGAHIEVWLAPQRKWLPVKLRFTDRSGNVTENVLVEAVEGV
jgi:hypothetical protein